MESTYIGLALLVLVIIALAIDERPESQPPAYRMTASRRRRLMRERAKFNPRLGVR